MSEIRK